jgi:crotonobetainyl-CoA:carnitine CoA-transferase CaiB-like acyl-CoA transferase
MGTHLLAGVRVVDMTDGRGELCGRFLADLGADVVLVEPPRGMAARRLRPRPAGVGAHFATRHYNKRGVVLDHTTPEGRQVLLDLLSTADIWVESTKPGVLARHELDPDSVIASHPHLVVVSVTEFGQFGPYAAFEATDPVHLALAAVLSRSGQSLLPPLIPPGALAYDATSFQAGWAALVGYWNRVEHGHGDHIDLSVFEATAQVLDPVFGTVGTARAGGSGLDAERSRPARATYPIYPCVDGHVRVVVLAARQWRNLVSWLGDPPELADPRLETVAGRNAAADLIASHVAPFLAALTVDEVVSEGQRRGIPLAPVLSPGEVLSAAHFVVRGAIIETEVAPGIRGRVANGLVEIDGKRAGFRRRAPALGEHTAELLTQPRPETLAASGQPVIRSDPLSGLRVVDFGVIVMGAETSRMFADLGAEVIRIENRAYPDGARAAIDGRMSASFAVGQRNKLSLGINLRTAEGREILKQLVAVSDIVLENFKPGTLDSLGLGWEILREVNPRLVMSSSSAMGSNGPWSSWMGYGPLVRSCSGLTSLWRYPDLVESFSDGVTILPDHLGARMVATATLAATIRARQTGEGVHIESAQAETILGLLSDLLLEESLAPGSGSVNGQIEQSVPWGVFPCAGDDEWCVITVRDDDDWKSLAGVIGQPPLNADAVAVDSQRRVHRSELEKWIAEWTGQRSPRDVMESLQSAGVPAGAMLRPNDLLADPHLHARSFIRQMDQPWLQSPVLTENGPFISRFVAEPRLEPAPLLGQHTRQVCERVLGVEPAVVEQLIESGILEEDR